MKVPETQSVMHNNSAPDNSAPDQADAHSRQVAGRRVLNPFGGVVMIGLGLLLGYLFWWFPVHHALASRSTVSYSPWTIMLPPLCLYIGTLLWAGIMRESVMYRYNEQGKKVMSPKGNLIFFGMVAVIALALTAWFTYLHAFGFRG